MTELRLESIDIESPVMWIGWLPLANLRPANPPPLSGSFDAISVGSFAGVSRLVRAMPAEPRAERAAFAFESADGAIAGRLAALAGTDATAAGVATGRATSASAVGAAAGPTFVGGGAHSDTDGVCSAAGTAAASTD